MSYYMVWYVNIPANAAPAVKKFGAAIVTPIDMTKVINYYCGEGVRREI